MCTCNQAAARQSFVVSAGTPAGSDVYEQPAAPVDAVVDTTGAGDCFTAAFSVALLDGSDPAAALKYATAAAALCVQARGAMSSLPLRRDVEAFLETF